MKIYFTNVGIWRCSIKRTLEGALKYLGQPSSQLELSLSVVTPEQIKQLNGQFRNVDAVTDVLSFPSAEVERKVIDLAEFDCDSINTDTGRLNLGDIIICLDRAKQQAEEYGHSVKREVCFLALHSLLHLLGYDHIEQEDEQEMVQLQREILAKLHVNR